MTGPRNIFVRNGCFPPQSPAGDFIVILQYKGKWGKILNCEITGLQGGMRAGFDRNGEDLGWRL